MTTEQPAGAGVDAIVDAAVATPTPETVETPEAPETTESPKTEAVDLAAQLKAAENKIARENRRIGKLTAQKYQTQQENENLKQQLAKYQQPTASQNTGEPTEEQFAGKPYGEYLKAVARWEARQESADRDRQAQTNNQRAEQNAWKEERLEHSSTSEQKAKAAYPDYQQLENEYLDVVKSFPDHIKIAFLEADDPAGAFYALAKDGSIEQLAGLSPTRAAAMIARAEDKAASMRKPVTKAPVPISAARGTAPGNKSIDQMSGDELLKWVNS